MPEPKAGANADMALTPEQRMAAILNRRNIYIKVRLRTRSAACFRLLCEDCAPSDSGFAGGKVALRRILALPCAGELAIQDYL